MPNWRDKRELDVWEETVQGMTIDRAMREWSSDRLFALAVEIFELGCFNLYGAIEPDRTAEEFARVRSLLEQAGVRNIPNASSFDFRSW